MFSQRLENKIIDALQKNAKIKLTDLTYKLVYPLFEMGILKLCFEDFTAKKKI